MTTQASAPASDRSSVTWRLALRVLARATVSYIDDRGTQMAAAISYYALFSLFPLTLLGVSIFGIVLRAPGVQERVLNAIIAFLPIHDQSIADSLRNVAKLGPTLTAVSAFGSLWAAGALSGAVRSALNVVFEVDHDRPFLRAAAIDYLLLPIIALPLIGGIAVTAAWRFTQAQVAARFSFADNALTRLGWEAGALAIPFALSFLAFMLTYKVLPNRYLRFRYLWPGALLATLGFEALKAGFGWYLERFANFDVVYGSLGSVIVLLFWIYLTATIVLFGAEVAAEVPHVLHEEPRHGTEPEGNWRASLGALLRGLVFVGDRPVEGPPPRGPDRG